MQNEIKEIGYSEKVIVVLSIPTKRLDEYIQAVNHLPYTIEPDPNISIKTIIKITCNGSDEISDLYINVESV